MTNSPLPVRPRAVLVGVQLPGVSDDRPRRRSRRARPAGAHARLRGGRHRDASAATRWPRPRCSARASSRSSPRSPAATAWCPPAPPSANRRRAPASPAGRGRRRRRRDGRGRRRRRRRGGRRAPTVRPRRADGGRRRPRALTEPGAQPGARHGRAGARSHRRHRRDLPPPRAEPRGAHAGRDRAPQLRRAAHARVAPAAASARHGQGAGESALELDRRKIRDRIAELREELARHREGAGPAPPRPPRSARAWRSSATPTPASRR